jgi:hypothetical protein
MKYSPASFAAVAFSLAFSPFGAVAQDGESSLYARCAQIADDAERLACFDSTYAQETQLLAERNAAEERETEDRFGLSDKQLSEREERETGEAFVAVNGEITAGVSEIYTDNRSKKRLFVLDNGQIWSETRIARMQRAPRVGQEVTISEATFGGYRLRVDGRRGFVDVKRMR